MRKIAVAAVLSFALTVAGELSAAHAGGHKSVKDWTAVCNNLGACAAFGFTGEQDDSQGYLKLTRDAGGRTAPAISVVHLVDQATKGGVWTLAVDGKPVTGVGPVRSSGGDNSERAALTGPAAASVVEALRDAATLQLMRDGKPAMTVSLAGSAAILLWVDDQQGRVGTITALSRKGTKAASAVPPPKPAPMVAVAAPVSQAGMPSSMPVAKLAALAATIVECDPDQDQANAAIVARLAPGVALWGPECSQGAYNELNVFFVGDEKGGNLHRVTFPESPGLDQTSDDVLMNVAFDPKTQTLSSLSKARGLADCGSVGDWVWDGKAFQLLRETFMDQCRGVALDDWPTIYVARRR
ncbi:MAG: DUF1176 domain-containing protein [Caulobacterales bacterium]